MIHHIQLWPRFEELRHLLGAGLRDIESRWSMGKGPLAVHFAADELKQLIRALFQNTDHRAATCLASRDQPQKRFYCVSRK